MASFTNATFSNHDDWMTPKSAWEAIKEYIPKDKVIWECFYGNGNSGRYLTELGYNVIHEDIDFFTHNLGDVLVSNPPFSRDLIQRVITRLHELDKPFIMIMPVSKLNCRYFDIFKNKIQLIRPNGRINFDKLVNGEIVKSKTSANFDCYYYCYKMNLVKDITWLN
jgi:hypothetical protein